METANMKCDQCECVFMFKKSDIKIDSRIVENTEGVRNRLIKSGKRRIFGIDEDDLWEQKYYIKKYSVTYSYVSCPMCDDRMIIVENLGEKEIDRFITTFQQSRYDDLYYADDWGNEF